MARILIVDDEKDVHYSFRRMLKNETDLELDSVYSGEEALSVFEHGPAMDLVLMDIRMGGMSGLEALRRMQRMDIRQKPLVIVMTAFSTADVAIEATKLGAFEYIIKPFDPDKIKGLVQAALHAREAMRRVVTLEEDEARVDSPETDRIVGRHPLMQEVYKLIGRVAGTRETVLIRGESGTGKELVARAIYHHSPRNDKMFLPMNCAAIPETLLESELFGHERGAFTGAIEQRLGKFEQCDGGTLFLDEIGDFSPSLQGKVLRLLEDRTFQRLGGNRWITTDVRILAATHRNLEQMVQEGKFREDLYYRLNVVSIVLPPLRDRREDIPPLAQFFLRKYSAQFSSAIKGLSREAIDLLMRYRWPGNVRQLENAVKRAMVVGRGEWLLPGDFHLPEGKTAGDAAAILPEGAPSKDEEELIRQIRPLLDKLYTHLAKADLPHGMIPLIERILIEKANEATSGNQVHSAKLLGLSRNTLRSRLKEMGLLGDREKSE